MLTNIRFKEGEEGIVNLEIEKGDVIKAMLGYLYGQDPTTADASVYITDYFADLFVAADFYDIPHLKEHAEERFDDWTERMMDKPEVAASLIRRLYTHEQPNEDSLRRMLSQHAIAHLDTLLDPALPSSTDMLKALQVCPGFGRDIAVLSANKIRARRAKLSILKCPDCGWEWTIDRSSLATRISCPNCGEDKHGQEWLESEYLSTNSGLDE